MYLFLSITATLAAFFLLQSFAFFVFWRLWLFPPVFLLVFFASQIFFYLSVFIFLTKNNQLFYNTINGENETKVNGANKITLFRITMLPFLILLTLVSQKYGEQINPASGTVLTAAFAITFASDFFDGRLARIKKMETYIGKILDSASDYLLLGITAGAFFYFNLISPWIFLIIIIRLFLNALVMLILFLVHRKLRPQTTPLGKIAIAAIMVLLVLEAARVPELSRWIIFAESAAAFVIGISMIDKVVYLIKGLGAPQNGG
ncbi:MAG: CDP-alcohol phosphatidyltransferase family protein [Treponema sp.]|nr:CDP-alcohol phosphatidyltransferase family protein [Treponema sp.]